MLSLPCNVCGRNDFTVRFESTLPTENGSTPDVRAFRCTSPDYGEHGRIVTCNHCGHVYTNPLIDADKLLALYADVEDETYVVEREGRYLTFEKHLAAMEKVTGPAEGRSLLDVGAYIGIFVEVARQHGWDAIGVEPSRWGVAQAEAAGVPVIQGTLDADELAGQTFDVITMWDVIEHLIDPAAELQKAYAKLNPGGLIAVHTMDVDALISKMMGKRWPWYMAMHIHFFSQRTMCQLLERIGFEVVWTSVQGRYLRTGYLASRLEGLSEPVGRFAKRVIDLGGLREVAVPVNFGDLFTVYAKKVEL